jgi:hypothetical protein
MRVEFGKREIVRGSLAHNSWAETPFSGIYNASALYDSMAIRLA